MTIDDEDLITPENLAGFISYLDAIEQRKNVSFNGVMGSMPEWMPPFHRNEFLRIRDNLLNDTYDYDGELTSEAKIIVWIDEYQMMGETDRQANIPLELMEVIGKLYQYRHAVKLGEIEGLRFLAGDYAVMGKRTSITASKNAEKPRPKKNCEQVTLDSIIKTLKQNHPDEKPSEVWVHFKTAIKEWSDADCKEYGEKDSRSYHYEIGDERGSIAYGTFRKKLNK